MKKVEITAQLANIGPLQHCTNGHFQHSFRKCSFYIDLNLVLHLTQMPVTIDPGYGVNCNSHQLDFAVYFHINLHILFALIISD